jgi:hypothetical protein
MRCWKGSTLSARGSEAVIGGIVTGNQGIKTQLFRFDLVLAAGRAAHGQNRDSGGSRFDVKNSNYWQLDCLSGKAPDSSGKKPL